MRLKPSQYAPLSTSRRALRVGISALLSTNTLLISTHSSAALFEDQSIGNPKALAMGNAVTADPPGIDSIHYNPAGLAKLKGRQYEAKLMLWQSTTEADFGDYSDDVKNYVPERLTNDLSTDLGTIEINGTVIDLGSIDLSTGVAFSNENRFDVDGDVIPNSSSDTDGVASYIPLLNRYDGSLLTLPSGGISYNPKHTRYTLATAAYMPKNYGFTRSSSDPGAFQGEVFAMSQFTYLSPSIAFEFDHGIYVGASVGISSQGLVMDSALRAPALMLIGLREFGNIGRLSMEMDDPFAISFNLGVLWEPEPWLTVGASYRSQTRSTVEGDFEIQYSENWQTSWDDVGGFLRPEGVASEAGSVSADLVMPQEIAFGSSIQLTPKIKVNLDLKWIDYDSIDNLIFEFSENIDFLTVQKQELQGPTSTLDRFLIIANPTNEFVIEREYRDRWNIGVGAEYQWNNQLALRCGYEYRPTPVPSDREDLFFPIGDTQAFSAGFSYKTSETSVIEAGITYSFSDTSTAANSSGNANFVGTEGDIDITSLGGIINNPYFGLDIDSERSSINAAISYRSTW